MVEPIVFAVQFLWYFWTFMLALPLLLIPGKPREFVGRRWDLVVDLSDGLA